MTSTGGRLNSNRKWWRRALARYGPVFCARVKIDFDLPPAKRKPKPEEVIHVFSASLERGYRHYAFETETERDAFVHLFWRVAEKCEVPIV